MNFTTLSNQQLRLAARPVGLPGPECWQVTEEPVAAPEDGGVLVQTLALSLDPAMRGWMNEGRSYIAPVGLGEVMRAGGIGRVIASRHARFAVGDRVNATLGAQQYAVFSGPQLDGLTLIDPALGSTTQWLNVLGMPGMTAYFGLLDIGMPQAGETVLVSGAAGAVGQSVGQLARIKGCRAVGIAGGAAKCEFALKELGFDACIDYKAAAPEGVSRWSAVREGLKQHCPRGVDIYFDNVGGDILDAALARMNRGSRSIICGAISQYNATSMPAGPKNYLSLIMNRGRMQGMVVFDYTQRFPQAREEIAGYLKAGRMVSREDVQDGSIADFPAALGKLFKGENFGKLVLRLAAG